MKLTIHIAYYWHKPQKRRAFFEKFARTNGFDPLVAANWYHIKFEDITNAKVFYPAQ